MRMPPLLADFFHTGACKPICEKFLTRPSTETQKGGPARNLLSHLILGIEKRTSAETLMSVNPSAHKSRYIQLSGFTQGRLRRSLAHITTVLFATSFSCRSLCFALNFSLTSVREAIKMR